MPFSHLLGRTAPLRIERLATHGAYLTLAPPGTDDPPVVLLPRKELDEGAKVGDTVEVFVYRDSDDRLIATRERPAIERGEVAFLRVASLAPFGAFFSWGLVKDLLVPFAEQTRDLVVGERHPIGLYVDDSGRLAGTMKIRELLADEPPFREGEWVPGEAWRKEPGLGVFVLLERAFLGLLPESEPHDLARGDAASFRIANVLPDGKVEVSLRRPGHESIADDATRVLDGLAKPGATPVGDHTSPEEIRARFGLSKKAFKRAAARLLAQGLVGLDASRSLVLKPRVPPKPRPAAKPAQATRAPSPSTTKPSPKARPRPPLAAKGKSARRP